MPDAQTQLRPQVLIVDDQPKNLTILSELFEGHCRVRVADSGERALRAAASTPAPDLILLDVMMPGMGGLEATRAIRQIPGREHLPILAMTANAFDEDRRQCMAAGMNDFISKPVNPEVMYTSLLKWLSKTAMGNSG